MIERVAEALWNEDQNRKVSGIQFTDTNAIFFGENFRGKVVPWSYIIGPNVIVSVSKEWRSKARAAIEAMRLPIDSMTCAGVEEAGLYSVRAADAADIYSAMIDSALMD